MTGPLGTQAFGGRSCVISRKTPKLVIPERNVARSQSRQRVVVCRAVRFPAALPLLPFTAKEVLPPGSCKVLRLYDNSGYMLLLEELLSSPHQMLVHSSVEPTNSTSSGASATSRLGAYEAGGFVFCLSTIVKVIDVKQTESGVLLRVQAEGRVAVKSLAQTQPYFRAVVVPVTDAVDLDRLQDVQNLAAKFKAPETANLQRAMHCRTAEGRDTTTAGPLGSCDDFQPSKILAAQVFPDTETLYTDSETISSGSDSEYDAQYAAAAATGVELPPPLPPPPVQLPVGSAGGGLAAAAVLGGGSGSILGGSVIRTRPSLLDLERACRLSLAAIQVLPQATEEEREDIRSHQAAAMETQDVLERLQLAQRVMGEARGLLSAKCALMALSAAS
ncbi:hypothetical protein VOLCADRAFT_119690 [Volvox carteri f. nagariensis]|uniref:Lon N-terminal domain-containing protein n=1 Tax=Volvox carteri f. nagariensis TaxID=3068 RepID=D8UFH8_VOLCA|nr:uncharacterized protein VOLCADRAFT_119690 [Volvox carteri f. nagariensis]EFJ41504.1 hypothetical protein VOLCADRAFT_119690 [Volvox carteri f. nagariensis]|eukprot:XP_002957449.1 hypothetical protein VOLCADRAFT_119690 [Volvox carteri f. nagariensis]